MTEPDASIVLQTKRFELRSLVLKDATNRYLAWLAEDNARRYILAARERLSLDDLRTYIESRIGRRDVLFLGIFNRTSGQHIGNLKYEPINESAGTAEMGILIGEPEWRGCGVAREVISASASWLRKRRGIRQILLGVEQDNTGAQAAYLRTGFRTIGNIRDPRAQGEIVRMSLEIDVEPVDRHEQ
jgi:[ribosomal protein S5]-alanine N-acetyltransferase